MTFQQFIEKYQGKYIDYDGVWGFQCMDEMHSFVTEVLGLTDFNILSAPCAKDVFTNFENISGHEQFNKIINTPEAIPLEGDIIFWGYNPYGHVAVFIEGDTNTFRSFDQNYPIGSPCHLQNHTYDNCLGWLRFKGITTVAVDKEVFSNLIRKCDGWDLVVSKLKVTDNKDIVLTDIDKLLTYEGIITSQSKDLEFKTQQITDIKKQAEDLQQTVTDLQIQNNSLQEKLDIAQKDLTTQATSALKQAETLKQVSYQLEELKKTKPIDQYSRFQLILYALFRKI